MIGILFDGAFIFVVDGEKVGAIRVVNKNKEGKAKRISPIFIMNQHRNNGYAQKAMKLVEEIHGISNWELDTILQEKGNCYLYGKIPKYCPTYTTTSFGLVSL